MPDVIGLSDRFMQALQEAHGLYTVTQVHSTCTQAAGTLASPSPTPRINTGLCSLPGHCMLVVQRTRPAKTTQPRGPGLHTWYTAAGKPPLAVTVLACSQAQSTNTKPRCGSSL